MCYCCIVSIINGTTLPKARETESTGAIKREVEKARMMLADSESTLNNVQ